MARGRLPVGLDDLLALDGNPRTVDLPPLGEPLGARLCAHALAVLEHVRGVVVGPEAEVQRRVRPVRHAAVAGREQDAAAVELEPQVVAHLIAFWSRSLTAAGSYPLNAAISASSRPSTAPSSLRSRAR